MNRRLVDALVWMIWASPLLYFAVSAQALPEPMASHFNQNGVADAYTSRSAYLWPLAGVILGAPLFLGWVLPALLGLDVKALNLPHRDHWLAPERQASTMAYLRSWFRWFAILVGVLFAFIHGLVLRANQLPPPTLTDLDAKAGVAMFLMATALWVLVLMLHFRRPR